MLKAQLLDSIALDTLPTYNLQQALKQDPLKVYKLSLKKSKLVALPQEILQFKNLNSLNLSRNKFQDFPTKIAKFKYLQILELSSNKLKTVPKELGLLVNLKKLYLNQNHIIALPSSIQYLVKLQYLDLWGNDIGFLPHEISALKNTLEVIDMRVILMSNKEHQKIKDLLPTTKIKFSKSCKCDF